MRPYAHFSLAANLYARILERPVPLERLAVSFFRHHRGAGAGDRRRILSLIYGVLRHHARLMHGLSLSVPNPSLLIAGYLRCMEPDFMVKVFSGYHGASLESIFSAAEIETLHHLTMPADIPECPAFLRTMPTHASFNAFSTTASIGLLVNTHRCDPESLVMLLENSGIKHVNIHSPYAISVPFGTNLTALSAYDNGLFAIQDVACNLAMMETISLAPKTILDFCAGSGGKTLALSLMHPKATLTAFDIDAKRLKPMAERLSHLGLPPVPTTATLSAITPRIFDLVVVDAPCTATGTWRRYPALKLHLTFERLQHFLSLQDNILHQAVDFVAHGQYLLYCTCSVLNAENRNQVDAFLVKHPDFIYISEHFYDPLSTDSDGFYACLLQKKAF